MCAVIPQYGLGVEEIGSRTPCKHENLQMLKSFI